MGGRDAPEGTPERKAALRERMRRGRARIQPDERRRLAALIEERLFSVRALARPGTAMVFSSFGSEVPTAGIVRRLHDEGWTLLLPFVEGGELHAARVTPGEPLVPTTYGPGEPAERTAVDPGLIDVVVLPGLAFDRQGGRLGYGGAYYDRYLPRLGRHAVRVGIAFHQQLVEEVPAGPEDERVDVLVTDREVVVSRPARIPRPVRGAERSRSPARAPEVEANRTPPHPQA